MISYAIKDVIAVNFSFSFVNSFAEIEIQISGPSNLVLSVKSMVITEPTWIYYTGREIGQ